MKRQTVDLYSYYGAVARMINEGGPVDPYGRDYPRVTRVFNSHIRCEG